MEVAGLIVGIASLIGLFENAMTFFTYVQSAGSSAEDSEYCMVRLELLHLRLSRWRAAVGLSEEVGELKDLQARALAKEDVSAAKKVLSQIASRFEDVAKITARAGSQKMIAEASEDNSDDQETLLQSMRRISSSRQCQPSTLEKSKWILLFEKIRHKSFRRQCELSAAKVKWVLYGKDKLVSLIGDLATLISELEDIFPRDIALFEPLRDRDAAQLVRLERRDPSHFSLLKYAMAELDAKLEETIAAILKLKQEEEVSRKKQEEEVFRARPSDTQGAIPGPQFNTHSGVIKAINQGNTTIGRDQTNNFGSLG